MSNTNEIKIVYGRLGKDPQLKTTNSGKVLAVFSIAISQGKDAPAQWLDVEVWAPPASGQSRG